MKRRQLHLGLMEQIVQWLLFWIKIIVILLLEIKYQNHKSSYSISGSHWLSCCCRPRLWHFPAGSSQQSGERPAQAGFQRGLGTNPSSGLLLPSCVYPYYVCITSDLQLVTVQPPRKAPPDSEISASELNGELVSRDQNNLIAQGVSSQWYFPYIICMIN